MIKVKNEYVEVKGTKADIIADLVRLVDTLKDGIPADDIRFAFNLGMKSEEEIYKIKEDLKSDKIDNKTVFKNIIDE